MAAFLHVVYLTTEKWNWLKDSRKINLPSVGESSAMSVYWRRERGSQWV